MTVRKALFTAVGLGATALLTLSGPAMASAATPTVERDIAVAGTLPTIPSTDCKYSACFDKSTDDIWVLGVQQDPETTVDTVVASWKNYLIDANGQQVLYRQGQCVNKPGTNGWASCDKDFEEDSTNPNAVGGQGSIIQLTTCYESSTDSRYHTCLFGSVQVRNDA